MEVIQHGDVTITRFSNSFKESNSFLVEINHSDSLWLFDIGNSPQIIRTLENRTLNGLFITHAHFDHIFGIKNLIEHHPECKILGSKQCIEWLSDDRKNLSFYYEKPLKFIPSNCYFLFDNDRIELDRGISIQAIATPGHTEDSMSYKIRSVLITGDSFIPNVPPVTKLKGGNKELFKVSLYKLKSEIGYETLLLPGHGPMYIDNKPIFIP